MQRYFANIINNKVILDDGDVHHLLNVIRIKKNEEIEVVFNSSLFLARIENLSPLSICVVEEIPHKVELEKDITLFFALAKGEKIDFIIQKATEIGAKRIVLMKTSRAVVKLDDKDFQKKLIRYERIAKEASEQSHRLIIPEIIGVVDIKNIPEDLMCDINYVAYEKEAGDTSKSFSELETRDNYSSASVFIGPEGGFSEEEIVILNKRGVKSISLGRRILRCETAGVFALSVMSYIIEK